MESLTNLWRPVEVGEKSGVTCAVGERGQYELSGTAAADANFNTQYFALAEFGLAEGELLTASGSIAGSIVRIRFYGADGSRVSDIASVGGKAATGAVPAGAVRLMLTLMVPSGKTASGTVWPMLERGSVAHPFVPYDLGGGAPLSNLWMETVKSYSADAFEFAVLDDGGVRVEGADEVSRGFKSNIRMRGEPGSLEPGVAHFLAVETPGDGARAQLIWQRADKSYVTVNSGNKFVLDADYIEAHAQVTTSAGGVRVDATVWPMLTRSEGPAGYYVPYERAKS